MSARGKHQRVFRCTRPQGGRLISYSRGAPCVDMFILWRNMCRQEQSAVGDGVNTAISPCKNVTRSINTGCGDDGPSVDRVEKNMTSINIIHKGFF